VREWGNNEGSRPRAPLPILARVSILQPTKQRTYCHKSGQCVSAFRGTCLPNPAPMGLPGFESGAALEK
jgi:hypothetical protein